jgi:hypothetical protein
MIWKKWFPNKTIIIFSLIFASFAPDRLLLFPNKSIYAYDTKWKRGIVDFNSLISTQLDKIQRKKWGSPDPTFTTTKKTKKTKTRDTTWIEQNNLKICDFIVMKPYLKWKKSFQIKFHLYNSLLTASRID